MTEKPFLPTTIPSAKPKVRSPLDLVHAIVFAGVTAIVALVSGLCPILMDVIQQNDTMAFIVYMCMGAMLAMATNFSLFLIFDRSHIGLQLLIAAMGIIGVYLAMAVGLCIAHGVTPGELIEGLATYVIDSLNDGPRYRRITFRAVEPIAILTTGAPLLILTATIPYWLGRIMLGWRLVAPGDTDRPPKMAIWHLFVATGIVAAAFPLMRVVCAIMRTDIVPVLIFFGVALAIYAAIQAIAIWSVFRAPYVVVGVLLATIPLMVTVVSAVVIKFTFTNRMATELSYGVPWMTAGFTIILILPMLVLRLFGRHVRAGAVEPAHVPPRPTSPFAEDHAPE